MRRSIPILALILTAFPCTADWSSSQVAGVKAAREGRYQDAERFMREALAEAEKAGPKDARRPKSLVDLADVLRAEGKYQEAVTLYERSCDISKKLFGEGAIEVSDCLDGLGETYFSVGDNAKAEPYLMQALAIREKTAKPDEPDVPRSQAHVAELYIRTERAAEAERLLQSAFAAQQESKRPQLRDLAETFDSLGTLYRQQHNPEKAEASYKQAWALFGKIQEDQHPDAANVYSHYGQLLVDGREFERGISLMQVALAIRKASYGDAHRDVAITLGNIGSAYFTHRQFAQSETFYKEALAIWEKSLTADDPALAIYSNNLAEVYVVQRKWTLAEPLLVRTATYDEKTSGPESAELASDLNQLGMAQWGSKKPEEAATTFARALAIRKKILPANDPLITETANSYVLLLRAIRRDKEAEAVAKEYGLAGPVGQ